MKKNQLDSEKIIIGDILNDLEAKKSTNDFLSYVFNIPNPYDFVSIKNRKIFVYIKNQLANKASLSLEKNNCWFKFKKWIFWYRFKYLFKRVHWFI